MLGMFACRSQHGLKKKTKIYEGKRCNDIIQFENHKTTKGKNCHNLLFPMCASSGYLKSAKIDKTLRYR